MKFQLEEAIEQEEGRVHQALTELLGKLFWKNYVEGYITVDDRHDLISLINGYTYLDYADGSGYYRFEDEQKVDAVIKTIRQKIGLEK